MDADDVGGYYDNIIAETKKNKVKHFDVFSSSQMKLSLICLGPKDSLHSGDLAHATQFITVVEGVGMAMIGEKTQILNPGMAIIVRGSETYNIINVSANDALKMYVISSGSSDQGDVPYLPRDVQNEVAFQGEVKDYIRMCMTDKGHWERCMVPGHWKTYMQGKSLQDAALIVRFALQYIDTHPQLFQEVGNEFLSLYAAEIAGSRVFKRGKAKGKAAKGVVKKLSAEESANSVILLDLEKLVETKMTKLVDIDYSEPRYGPLDAAHLLTSPLARKYVMMDKFNFMLIQGTVASDGSYLQDFIEDFIGHVRITNRSLDDRIMDLYYIWDKLQEGDYEFDAGTANDVNLDDPDIHDSYIDFFVDILTKYIKHNGKTAKTRLCMATVLVKKIDQEEVKEEMLGGYSRYV